MSLRGSATLGFETLSRTVLTPFPIIFLITDENFEFLDERFSITVPAAAASDQVRNFGNFEFGSGLSGAIAININNTDNTIFDSSPILALFPDGDYEARSQQFGIRVFVRSRKVVLTFLRVFVRQTVSPFTTVLFLWNNPATSSLNKEFILDGAGEGMVTVTVVKNGFVPTTANEADADVTLKFTSNDLPADEWDFDDLTKRHERVWYPKYYTVPHTSGPPDPGFNWSFQSSVVDRPPWIQGRSTFIDYVFAIRTWRVTSGRLPNGVTVDQLSLPWSIISAEPGPDAGFVVLELDLAGENIESEPIYWQVDGGLFTSEGSVVGQLDLSAVMVGETGPEDCTELYPSPYTNSAFAPGVGFDWRITAGQPAEITPIGSWPNHTFSIHSGTLAEGLSLNSTTGVIATPVFPDPIPIGFPATGDVVVKIVDTTDSSEQFSCLYAWEYV